MDFLWHAVSKKEKEEVKKQAKAIMDAFSKKLSKIDKKIAEPLIERDNGERQEVKAPSSSKSTQSFDRKKKEKNTCANEDFRNIMFENAPNKNRDFIIAEKKKW